MWYLCYDTNILQETLDRTIISQESGATYKVKKYYTKKKKPQLQEGKEKEFEMLTVKSGRVLDRVSIEPFHHTIQQRGWQEPSVTTHIGLGALQNTLAVIVGVCREDSDVNLKS